jgi:hypothetical protein
MKLQVCEPPFFSSGQAAAHTRLTGGAGKHSHTQLVPPKAWIENRCVSF